VAKGHHLKCPSFLDLRFLTFCYLADGACLDAQIKGEVASQAMAHGPDSAVSLIHFGRSMDYWLLIFNFQAIRDSAAFIINDVGHGMVHSTLPLYRETQQ
jgi:hypothetical protein